MKQPERFPPDDPREWLNRARSSLALAGNDVPGVYFEDLCFEAQQAAEKALKALLMERDVDFPYVHDLARLLKLLEDKGDVVPSAIAEVGKLTRYASVSRYPDEKVVTEQEYRDALAVARAVVGWVEGKL